MVVMEAMLCVCRCVRVIKFLLVEGLRSHNSLLCPFTLRTSTLSSVIWGPMHQSLCTFQGSSKRHPLFLQFPFLLQRGLGESPTGFLLPNP